MKNIFKARIVSAHFVPIKAMLRIAGIIAITAMIVFSMAACGGDDSNNSNNPNNPGGTTGPTFLDAKYTGIFFEYDEPGAEVELTISKGASEYVIQYTESYSNSGAITWTNELKDEKGTYNATITNAGEAFGTLKVTISDTRTLFEFDTDYGKMGIRHFKEDVHNIDEELVGVWESVTFGFARVTNSGCFIAFCPDEGVEALRLNTAVNPTGFATLVGLNSNNDVKFTANRTDGVVQEGTGKLMDLAFVNERDEEVEVFGDYTYLRVGMASGTTVLFRRSQTGLEPTNISPFLAGTWTQQQSVTLRTSYYTNSFVGVHSYRSDVSENSYFSSAANFHEYTLKENGTLVTPNGIVITRTP